MKIIKELFVIPEKDNYILYSPLKKSVMKVNRGVVKILKDIKEGKVKSSKNDQTIEGLVRGGVLEEEGSLRETLKDLENSVEQYSPNAVILIPTHECNLRCQYCYAKGGEDIRGVLDLDTANKAIDFILENAQKDRKKGTNVTFHGGGEPLLSKNLNLVEKILGYYKKSSNEKDLKTYCGATSNCVFSDKTREFVLKNFDRMNISLDGPEEIQNKQRPLANGKGSYSEVLKTIEFFERNDFKYALRSTITKDSVTRISEIIEFFHSISPNKEIQLEPLFKCGRCKISGIQSPKPEDFIRYYIKGIETARSLGANLLFSGSKINSISSSFCGAAGRNFFVTPEGLVTTCLEVSRSDDIGHEIFIIGKYNTSKKEFEFYKDKIKNLSSRTVFNLPYCQDCFVKFNCAGDCLVRTYKQSGDVFDNSKNIRCQINREIFKYELSKKIDTKNGKLSN